MHATMRHDDGVETLRAEEETSKAGVSPLPALRKLPRFSGCYVFADEHHPETVTNRSGRLS